MTQEIVLKEVKAAAARAYDHGLLLAQGDSQTQYGYSQVCKDGVRRFCAIGASLTEDTLNAIKANNLDSASLNSLVHEEKLSNFISWKKRQAKKLALIQFSHDQWMKLVKRSNPETLALLKYPDQNPVREAERDFLKSIGHKAPVA